MKAPLLTFDLFGDAVPIAAIKPASTRSASSTRSKKAHHAPETEEEIGALLEAVRHQLAYEPETGFFRYLAKNRWHEAGDLAGNTVKGYVQIAIHTSSGWQWRYAHRLAWLVMTRTWPKNEIDHRNHDGLDNRWSNLRAATHAENLMNRRRRLNTRPTRLSPEELKAQLNIEE